MSLSGIFEDKYVKLLPFHGCARFSRAAENHNKPFLYSPPFLLLCQTFPNPSYFDPFGLSHVYLYGHINLSQNKPHLGKASARPESWYKSATLHGLHCLRVV